MRNACPNDAERSTPPLCTYSSDIPLPCAASRTSEPTPFPLLISSRSVISISLPNLSRSVPTTLLCKALSTLELAISSLLRSPRLKSGSEIIASISASSKKRKLPAFAFATSDFLSAKKSLFFSDHLIARSICFPYASSVS